MADAASPPHTVTIALIIMMIAEVLMTGLLPPVSYTHLTLPTILLV